MKNKKIVQKAGSKFLVMSLSVAMIGGMMNASMFSPTTVLAEEADFAVEEIAVTADTLAPGQYTFDQLERVDAKKDTGGTGAIDPETKVLTVNMTKQYGQVHFRIPEELDKKVITGVTLNLAEGSTTNNLSVKMHTQEDFDTDNRNGDVAAVYGNNTAPSSSDELGYNARYLSIMTTAQSGGEYSFESVTFTYKNFSRNIKNDIMTDFNGSFENAYWWNDGSWGEIGAGKSQYNKYVKYTGEDPAPADSVGDYYAKVTDPAASGDGDGERPTLLMNYDTGIKAGRDYEFAYWVKLAESTEVENPEVKLGIQTHDGSWGGSVFANVTYDDEYTLTTDWQKVSGTISIPDGASAQQKIYLQGSDGINFCVDNLQIAAKWVSQIQQDIPNLYESLSVNGIPYTGVAVPAGALDDDVRMQLVFKHFNSITCENEMKPETILGTDAPEGNINSVDELTLNFGPADAVCDAVVSANTVNGTDVKMRGHVFVWHSQTPTWFFREGFRADGDYVTKDVMNQRMKAYIKRVAEHFDTYYPGLIYAWDVVNEQASDAGGIRTGTDWANVYGGSDEYIINAFKYADEYVDSDTILFYNDYNECTPAKCETICEFIKKIKEAVPDRKIGAGMQGHHDMASPTKKVIKDAMVKYATVADVVHITELDIKSTVGFVGTDLETEFTKNGYRYKEIYDIVKEVNAAPETAGKIQNITIWGTHDAVSWLKTSNNVGGSADGKTPQYPLIFDEEYQAKPGYWAFVKPSELKPYIRKLDAMQSDNWDYAIPVSYEANDAKVTIAPLWNEEGVKLHITVEGNTLNAADTITVYSADGKTDDVTKITSETKGVSGVSDSNKCEFDFTLNKKLKVRDKVLFDVVFEHNGVTYAFNDTTLAQASNSQYYAEIVMKPLMGISYGKALIDGDEAEWGTISGNSLEVKSSKNMEASAVAKVAWDEENLYVMMDVTDPSLDNTSVNEYEQDSMEVFIDEKNEKAGSFDENDKQYRVSYTNHQSFNGSMCKPEYIESATKMKEDGTGYIIEAAIKWTAIKPIEGGLIGLDLQINDGKDGSRLGTANWYDESGNGYQNPGVYGTAYLMSASVSSEDIKAAEAVNELINAIGDVDYTDACKEKIEDAYNAYKALPVAVKGKTDAKILESALATYEKLENSVKVAEVKGLISAIAKLDVKDAKAIIDAAREAYDALTDDQKAKVPAASLKALEDAEKAYDALSAAQKAEAEKKAKEDAAKADAVKKAIAAIGKVDASEDSKAKVEAARKAYAALTEDQKKLVEASQLKLLTEAEAAYQQAVEESKKPTEETKPEDATKYVAKFSAKSTSIQKRKSSTNLAKDIAITAGDKIVKWETSNKKVVTVTNKGKITGKKVGKATITVTTDKGAKASITVYVKAKKVATTKVTVKNAKTDRVVKKVTLKKGKKLTLKVVTNPITTPDKVTFKSSKKSVATVTNKGVITAKKKGKATITVKSGKKTAKVQITVK